MNIKNIKRRANELLLMNKEAYLRVLFIMLLVEMIPAVIGEIDNVIITFISLILIIAFLPFNHGYVVSSLKVVRNNAQALDDQDAFVGFKRFSELFGTYFLISFIQFICIFVVAFIAYIVIITSSASLYSETDPFVILSALAMPLLLLGLIIGVIAIVLNAYLFSTPYVLEQYGYTGMDAVKKSCALIKGHVWDAIKLELSFLGWVIMIALISGGLTIMLDSLGVIGSLIASFAASVIGLLTYVPKYRLAIAVFFEELAYEKDHPTTQSNATYIQGE